MGYQLLDETAGLAEGGFNGNEDNEVASVS